MKKNIYKLIVGGGFILLSTSCGSRETTYEGYLKDAKTGDPLGNAKVGIIDFEKKKEETVNTDENGYYRFPVSKLDKEVKIGYTCSGYQSILKELIITKEENEKNKGKIIAPDVLLTMDTMGVVIYRGKVRDAETGEPISGVSIGLSGLSAWRTSKQGNYLISFIKGEDKKSFVYNKTGYKQVTVDTVLQPVGSVMYVPDILMEKESNNE